MGDERWMQSWASGRHLADFIVFSCGRFLCTIFCYRKDYRLRGHDLE